MGLNRKDLDGGPGGVRTLDLMTASHARSQLRHRPAYSIESSGHWMIESLTPDPPFVA